MTTVTLQNTASTKWKNWYLDLDGHAEDPNGELLLWESLGSGAKWKMTELGGGIVTFQNTANTKWKNWYLDLDGHAEDPNGRLLLWESLGSGAKWKMTELDGGLVPAFPINAKQHSELGNHHRMRTRIKVSNTGRLDAWVRTWTANKTEGFKGQVVVFLLDQYGNILWNSQDKHRYGINATGPFENENSRDDTFTEKIPPAALMRTRQAYIYHRRNPKTLKEILDDVATTVEDIDHTYNRIKNTDLAQDIATATA